MRSTRGERRAEEAGSTFSLIAYRVSLSVAPHFAGFGARPLIVRSDGSLISSSVTRCIIPR
jgi:hypothetical protein